MNLAIQKQDAVCRRFGAIPSPCVSTFKVGISPNVKEGILPINGLRVKTEGDTTGWYIWAGDTFSEDPDFFFPLHVAHLDHWCPKAIPYLSLPTGWRFQIAPDHEDVWFDTELAAKEVA